MGIVGEQLASLGFTRLVISPFQRCLETAKQLNVKLQLPYSSWQIDSEVCEASVCVVGHIKLQNIGLVRQNAVCRRVMCSMESEWSAAFLKQVLSPKTLVGSQLEPPVGLAKDWMWGQSNLRAALVQVLGKEGTSLATAP